MKKYLKTIANETLNDIRESGNTRLDEAFNDGYNEAANICVEIINQKIDALFNNITSNSYLTNQEQFMLSNLKELKSETEEQLRKFWNDNE